MRLLVTAIVSPFGKVKAAPTEIVYIPEGEHQIYPQSHPKGIKVKMTADRGEAVAAAFQRDLDKLNLQNVGPRLDFDHIAAGPASGFPTAFRYQSGVGLMCSVDWSAKGKSAIEGREYRYFSPRFDLDDDDVPAGLPNRGPLGGLVNDPAFREIPAVAAADAGELEPQDSKIMKTLLAALGIDDAHKDAESSGVKKIEELAAAAARVPVLEKENGELKSQVKAAETATKAAAEKRAKDLVEAAVADGRIAPKDEETQTGFIERISAGDAFTEKQLANLPKKNGDLRKPVIAGGADRQDATSLDKQARELVTAGEAKTLDEGREMVLASSPDAYNDYLASLSE
ncbi:phage protease [Luteolibacter luteus]|uniref:Uncharacterized protein n=1 Tax=Luteolibacter luteus TaxID=2728835 RepID=A0A858RGP7_9BACT|nr:phage protease [Luteolibacter luteus]QJE95962.1 hypothetical protein HHL09_09265 [Luteolibacter luteus]